MRGATDVLTAAFARDPGFAYVLPDDTARPGRLRAIWAAAVRHCERVGGVERAGEDGAGVAVWTDDTTMEIGPVAAVRSGSVALPVRIGPGAMRRLTRMEREGDDLVRDSVQRPFGYLMGLAVHPDAQGRGLARPTVEAVAAAVAARGRPRLALRTENPRNVPLYEHLGFEVAGRLASATTGLEVTAMAMEL